MQSGMIKTDRAIMKPSNHARDHNLWKHPDREVSQSNRAGVEAMNAGEGDVLL